VIEVRLEELLRKRGKSRYWLAKETNLTPLTISRLFKGKTNGIDFNTLNSICAALRCQPSDVIAYVEDEASAKQKR
jgi:putative transcriptional regulator